MIDDSKEEIYAKIKIKNFLQIYYSFTQNFIQIFS